MHETSSTMRTSISAAVLAMIVCSCTPNQRIVESNGQWSNTEPNRVAATPVKSSLEQDIESMRTADFTFIYVIRRKDGGALDDEDKRFAAAVIPSQMNRRSLSDEGKAILIGSNYRMPDDSRKLIEDRFAVEVSREAPATNSNLQPNR